MTIPQGLGIMVYHPIFQQMIDDLFVIPLILNTIQKTVVYSGIQTHIWDHTMGGVEYSGDGINPTKSQCIPLNHQYNPIKPPLNHHKITIKSP